MTQYLNLAALEEAGVKNKPFPFFTIDQVLVENKIIQLMDEFPKIESGGSYTLEGLSSGPAFAALIEELNGEGFRKQISEKFLIDLSALPMVVTLRGVSRARDGRVHTDSKSKIVTILIYFNDLWTAETGKLRLLNSSDINDVVAEVVPNAGSLVAFKVTDNCWHGYPAYEGARRSIQINYVADEAAVKKHHGRHGWTAKFKNLKKMKILGGHGFDSTSTYPIQE